MNLLTHHPNNPSNGGSGSSSGSTYYPSTGNSGSSGSSGSTSKPGSSGTSIEAELNHFLTHFDTPEERKAVFLETMGCDYFLMSSNAVTIDGELINVDGNSNRVACLCHGPEHVLVLSGDHIYKMDYEKLLDYHIEKKADITVAVKDMTADDDDLNRFGIIRLDDEQRIVNFEEKPLVAQTNTVSIGVYVIRRRLLIELIQKAHEEGRTDFVKDILVRYKDVKKIYGYKHEGYWKNIATIESYEQTNKDFLKREIRDYFFREYPNVYSKIDDLPPAKFNPGAAIKNSLISSGCIINGKVQDSILFKKVYIGNNCVIKNSIILNDVYIGDNTVIENCIVESRDTIRANSTYKGEDGKVKIVLEKRALK